MTNHVAILVERFFDWNPVKIPLSRFVYGYINHRVRGRDLTFLNYGYAPLDESTIPLQEQDEPNRTCIQLYHVVGNAVERKFQTVMEMSCGRGGGANYLAKHLKPSLFVAVDRQASSILFCRKTYSAESLRFVCADALSTPFADNTFDAVINVEASHNYPDMDEFLSEVKRVLRPGGYLLYTDYRRRQKFDRWQRELGRSGLRIIEKEDITDNVVRALEHSNDNTRSVVRRNAPWFLRSFFRQFAGVKGSDIYKAFDARRMTYMRYVLRKDG